MGDEAFFRKRAAKRFCSTWCPTTFASSACTTWTWPTSICSEMLDRARTPSLMAPFQVFFIRGVKNLYGRGKHDEEFAAIEDYFTNPNPDAMLVFVADHISIPADVRRMDMTDKDRYERIRETLGEYCSGAGVGEGGRRRRGELGHRNRRRPRA